MKCTCKYCQDIDYDNSIFVVDPSHLQRERPIGVTGLLRVKNDAEFLALCIDSCIDALDELIIVYQECTDNSPEIIEQKRKQYPEKIKSYYYRPRVLSHRLSDEEFAYASALPSDSIHLLCNYYNYTLSKASFRYALKIDADQIYFSDKLREVCDAYRSQGRKKITLTERIAGIGLYLFANLVNVFPRLLSSRLRFFVPSEKSVKAYQRYALKKIANKKCPISFSGINLLYDHAQWQLPLGNYPEGLFPPFNGIHDHLIFQIGPDTYYEPAPMHSSHTKYGNSIIEKFSKDRQLMFYKSIFKPELLYGGFLWYHVAPLKQDIYPAKLPGYKDHMIPLFESRIPYAEIEEKITSPLRRWMRGWYCVFWSAEQQKLSTQYLSSIDRIIHSYSNGE